MHVPVRWSDLDACGHVNNARLLTLLEEARIAAFWAGGSCDDVPAEGRFTGGPGSSTNTFVVRQEVEYLRPLPFLREPARIDLWVCKMGGASIDVGYEVFDGEGRVAARAITVIVLVDAQTHRPRRLSEAEKQAWQPWTEEPPKMRR